MKHHLHRFKFRQTPEGLLRYCKCGERVLEISRPNGSFIDAYPVYKPPAKNRKRL